MQINFAKEGFRNLFVIWCFVAMSIIVPLVYYRMKKIDKDKIKNKNIKPFVIAAIMLVDIPVWFSYLSLKSKITLTILLLITGVGNYLSFGIIEEKIKKMREGNSEEKKEKKDNK